MESHFNAARPKPDQVLVDIARYVLDHKIDSTLAYETARNCLIDTLGCGLEALDYPACTKLLGPIVPGMVLPHGARVPGTSYQLDPVQAAFNIGTSCSLSPEKLLATNVAPILSAIITGSIGAIRLGSPRLLFDPTSAEAENWPFVSP